MIKFTIEQARMMSGLSQKEMSEKLGCSESTYVQYEKYRRVFRMDMAHKFCETTKINPSDIIFFDKKYGKSVVS